MMDLGLIRSRISTLETSKDMYKDLFTAEYIFKNSLFLNYNYRFKPGDASSVMNIDLKVTKRCNADCYFCYSDITKGQAKELSSDEIIRFVNSFGRQRKAFFLTGGDPFMRKDIFKIIQGIKNQGSFCGIVTNGTLFTENRIKELIDSGIDNVVFSLHGINNTNDSVMELKNSFEKIIAAVSQLRKEREKTKKKAPYILLNSVINPSTISEFNQIVYTADKAGADEIRFSHPSFLYPEEAEQHRIESKELFGSVVRTGQYITKTPPIHSDPKAKSSKIVKQLKKLKDSLKTDIKVSFYPHLTGSEQNSWYESPFKTERKCLVLYTSCFIDELGNVNPCQFYRVSMGNILERNFDDIWNSPKYKKFRRIIRKSLLPGCSRCCKLF